MLRLSAGLAIAGLSLVPFQIARADPPPRHRVPPQAAFDACRDQSEGDACSVTFHDKKLDGTCETFGDKGLACRPTPPPPPQEAIDACKDAAQGDACSATFHEHELKGTCETYGSDSALACRPSHPPQHE
jgi:hypothetical protein